MEILKALRYYVKQSDKLLLKLPPHRQMLEFLGSYKTMEGKPLPVDFSPTSAEFWNKRTKLLERIYDAIKTSPLSTELCGLAEISSDAYANWSGIKIHHNDSHLFNPSCRLNQGIADAHFYQKGARRSPMMFALIREHSDGSVHFRYYTPLVIFGSLQPPPLLPNRQEYEEWKIRFSTDWNKRSGEPDSKLLDLPYYTLPGLRCALNRNLKIRNAYPSFSEFATWMIHDLPSDEIKIVT